MKIKLSPNCEITLPLTVVGNHAPVTNVSSRKIFAIILFSWIPFKGIHENKILAKNSEFTINLIKTIFPTYPTIYILK